MANQIKQLKSAPIQKVAGFSHQDYLDRKSYYHRQVICNLAVETKNGLTNDPIVSCCRAGLLVRNYYWQSKLLQPIKEVQEYLTADLFLRQSIVADLVLIDTFLQIHGLRLLILSGYRHPKLQGIIIREVEKLKGSEFANKMFANPEFYAPHTTGAAFDLEIWDEENEELLPTKVPAGLDRHCLEGKQTLSFNDEDIRDNRRLIHNLLTTDFILSGKNRFVGHPFEYWHYGRHERLSSFFAADGHPIYYGVVNLTF